MHSHPFVVFVELGSLHWMQFSSDVQPVQVAWHGEHVDEELRKKLLIHDVHILSDVHEVQFELHGMQADDKLKSFEA